MLRIIAGKYRSRILEQPPLSITRPTIDRAREALFNIIQNNIENSVVLDCFAGSGAFCFEAVSRGATKAIAIEKNPIAFAIIQKNLEKLNINNMEVKNMDSLNYLEHAKNIQFDFIYLDPPYKLDVLKQCLGLIAKNQLLKRYGKIIIETNIDTTIDTPNELIIIDERIYGKTKFIFINWID
ncbi:16S rRNA (guanine(966)-N(2))-methyltransferase RsmD [Metamycoplasma sualvi]|uniref:16S rRNA (guanine(966)-N(2))-methyltransferase RsmD n=1 Tax=Metamycoplasma sualvi TaxID=2125 RepID=UPI0038733B82